MPIRINPDTDKSTLQRRATQATIKFLSKYPKFIYSTNNPISILQQDNPKLDLSIFNNSPELLASFVSDLVEGTHIEWTVYKIQYSELVMEQSKGRPEPNRKSGGVPVHKTERQAQMYQRWGQTHTPNLNLGKYKTDKERIKAILKSDCAPQIKAELLGVYK